MNSCNYKSAYSKEALQNLRDFYKMAQQLYEEHLSYEDNIMKLLTFSALHASEVEQSALFKGKIPVMTLHQAKGLEFDGVILADGESYLSIEDKHLFYTACTRALHELHIYTNTSLENILPQDNSLYTLIDN